MNGDTGEMEGDGESKENKKAGDQTGGRESSSEKAVAGKVEEEAMDTSGMQEGQEESTSELNANQSSRGKEKQSSKKEEDGRKKIHTFFGTPAVSS